MCGIFAYYGEENCSEIIVEGLKNLEYRGYDSWGVALKVKENIFYNKQVGKISNAKRLYKQSKIGIGHTRWATHGKVNKMNSHPHHDVSKRFFVVHNGIIENYEKLKNKNSYSETDSEVIPQLIAKHSQKGFLKAVQESIKVLKGNYSFVVIDKFSNQMIGVRNGSPLILGVDKKGNFLASDVTPFLKYTKKVIFLNDGEIVFLNKNKIKILNFKGKEIIQKPKLINWDFEKSIKNNYEHFMLKEIYEQPKVINETIKAYLNKTKFKFNEYLTKNAIANIKEIKKIIIVACGTSWHAGLISRYWFESFSNISAEVEYASEFRYRDPLIEKGTLVLAISQSGETADTIAAIKEAKKKGAKIISIINVIGSTIDRMSDIKLYTRAGPEIGVASTKAFTTQLTILILLSLFFAKNKRSLKNKEILKKLKEINKVPFLIKTILSKEKEIKFIANKHYNKKNALFLGRGVNYPIALEGALKLKEISYIHAEGYPAAEMKHGPIALIDKDMPSVFICVKDHTYEKVISNIQEVKARKGVVIAIATEGDKNIKKISDFVFYIPEIIGSISPFLSVIPLQMLAYEIAKKKKCEIDKPRNLAKSVTVE